MLDGILGLVDLAEADLFLMGVAGSVDDGEDSDSVVVKLPECVEHAADDVLVVTSELRVGALDEVDRDCGGRAGGALVGADVVRRTKVRDNHAGAGGILQSDDRDLDVIGVNHSVGRGLDDSQLIVRGDAVILVTGDHEVVRLIAYST